MSSGSESLTAMWQVDVPQISAKRVVIGRPSQGKRKPFTSAPITPGHNKVIFILTMLSQYQRLFICFSAGEKIHFKNYVFFVVIKCDVSKLLLGNNPSDSHI